MKRKETNSTMTQGRAARVLRVSRPYLNKVLKGRFKSPRVLALYNDLIAQPTNPNPQPKI